MQGQISMLLGWEVFKFFPPTSIGSIFFHAFKGLNTIQRIDNWNFSQLTSNFSRKSLYTFLGMTTSFGSSGMCLWGLGERYVTLLQGKNVTWEWSRSLNFSDHYSTRGTYKTVLLSTSCNPLTGERTTLLIPFLSHNQRNPFIPPLKRTTDTSS